MKPLVRMRTPRRDLKASLLIPKTMSRFDCADIDIHLLAMVFAGNGVVSMKKTNQKPQTKQNKTNKNTPSPPPKKKTKQTAHTE